MFIGIRFEWSALEALFVQTCSLHTVRLKHNIRRIKIGIKITSFESPSFPICVKKNAGTRARTAHCLLALQCSAAVRSLRYARLLAPFTESLIYFAHSLVGQLKFMNVFML